MVFVIFFIKNDEKYVHLFYRSFLRAYYYCKDDTKY